MMSSVYPLLLHQFLQKQVSLVCQNSSDSHGSGGNNPEAILLVERHCGSILAPSVKPQGSIPSLSCQLHSVFHKRRTYTPACHRRPYQQQMQHQRPSGCVPVNFCIFCRLRGVCNDASCYFPIQNTDMHGAFSYGPFRNISCRIDALFEYGECSVRFLVLKVLVVCLFDLLQIIQECLADHNGISVVSHAAMSALSAPIYSEKKKLRQKSKAILRLYGAQPPFPCSSRKQDLSLFLSGKTVFLHTLRRVFCSLAYFLAEEQGANKAKLKKRYGPEGYAHLRNCSTSSGFAGSCSCMGVMRIVHAGTHPKYCGKTGFAEQ